jgi:hypothetical protein
VLKFQGDNSGGHYEVVREMSTSREQPDPHNTIYTEKRKQELPQPDRGGGSGGGGGGGGGGAPPGEPTDPTPSLPGERTDGRKRVQRSGRGVSLSKSAYVYEWCARAYENQSYAFPDDREPVPRKTERMLADGNELYR